MAESYYKPCKELDICNELIEKYFNTQQYNLAWFYEDAIGVERDMEQAAFWYRKAALQAHNLAMEKCRELGISLDNAVIDQEGIRKALKCRLFPLNDLSSYKYTVICSNYEGKWILSRHRKRDT